MTTPLPVPRLHTLAEVAERIPRMSLRSLREAARRREFRHVRFGRERYLTDEQLEEFLATYTVTDQRAADMAKTSAQVTRARKRRHAA